MIDTLHPLSPILHILTHPPALLAHASLHQFSSSPPAILAPSQFKLNLTSKYLVLLSASLAPCKPRFSCSTSPEAGCFLHPSCHVNDISQQSLNQTLASCQPQFSCSTTPEAGCVLHPSCHCLIEVLNEIAQQSLNQTLAPCQPHFPCSITPEAGCVLHPGCHCLIEVLNKIAQQSLNQTLAPCQPHFPCSTTPEAGCVLYPSCHLNDATSLYDDLAPINLLATLARLMSLQAITVGFLAVVYSICHGFWMIFSALFRLLVLLGNYAAYATQLFTPTLRTSQLILKIASRLKTQTCLYCWDIAIPCITCARFVVLGPFYDNFSKQPP
jgi:hypothetical protein